MGADIESATSYAKTAVSLEGSISLVSDSKLRERIQNCISGLRTELESLLLQDQLTELEKELLTTLNDAFWRIEQDACIGAMQTSNLIATQKPDVSNVEPRVIAIYRSLNLVLRSLDRIEVRGRDSAGISIALSGILLEDATRKLIEERSQATFGSESVNYVETDGSARVYFVYKRAAEIGELGDN